MYKKVALTILILLLINTFFSTSLVAQETSNSLTYLYSVATDYFTYPYNLTIDKNGEIYAVDQESVIKKFNSNDIIAYNWRLPAELSARLRESSFVNISAIDDLLYITMEEKTLIVTDLEGNIILDRVYEDLSWFYSLAPGLETNTFYLADNSSLYLLDQYGDILSENKYANLWYPTGLHSNSLGQLIITNTGSNEIAIFDSALDFVSTFVQFNEETCKPYSLAIDYADRIYFTNLNKPEIYIYSSSGDILTIYTPIEPKELQQPTALVIKDNYLYVADRHNNRIQKYQINYDYLDSLEKDLQNPSEESD